MVSTQTHLPHYSSWFEWKTSHTEQGSSYLWHEICPWKLEANRRRWLQADSPFHPSSLYAWKIYLCHLHRFLIPIWALLCWAMDESPHVCEAQEVDQSLLIRGFLMLLSIEHTVHHVLGYILLPIFFKDQTLFWTPNHSSNGLRWDDHFPSIGSSSNADSILSCCSLE